MAAANGLKGKLGRRALLASAIALIGLAGPAMAYDAPGLVDLQVVDRETGQVLPVWRRDGRLFVAGDQGGRYSLRVTNHTDGRMLVVLSVDGVNVISGETARQDGRGYILGPHGSYDVVGWRKSETEVAAFAFTALPNSYAARTGRPGEVGVIGMAVFKERPQQTVTPLAVSPQPAPERRSEANGGPSAKAQAASPSESVVVTSRRQAAPADVAPPPPLPIPPVQKPLAQAPERFADRSSEPADAKLGTAHGALEWSVSHVAPFVRATPYPQLTQQIEYDSYRNLAAAGVIPYPPGPGRPPNAFPGNRGFVPDPPARF